MSENGLFNVSATVYALPRSHWHCSFDNFDWTGHEKKYDALEELLLLWDEGEQKNLAMIGPPGTGKTHLSVAMYRWAVLRSGTDGAYWLNVPDFCDKVKQSFDRGSYDDPFERMQYIRRLLVLDDLFGRELTSFEMEQIVYRLVDMAYRNAASLVFTTNYDMGDIQSKLTPHEMSRVFQNADIWKFTGEDKRL